MDANDPRIRRFFLIGYFATLGAHLAFSYWAGVPFGISGEVGLTVGICTVAGFFLLFIYWPHLPKWKPVLLGILLVIAHNRGMEYLDLLNMGGIPEDYVWQVLVAVAGYTLASSAVLGAFWRWMANPPTPVHS